MSSTMLPVAPAPDSDVPLAAAVESPLLEMRGLSLSLGKFRLGPLWLQLCAGDYLVLLGPSGCGKTSLLRALAGIYPLRGGGLFLDGIDIGALPPHQRGVGYVSQTADLFPHMNVAKNIAFGLSYGYLSRGERRAKVEHIARLLDVSALLERAPATLSGGEAKRIALARSLVLEPRLLLLDEPLSMLDHNARRRMLELLRTVHDQTGTTTVHVTHDREEAWALGGRCAVMNAGRLEGEGSAEDMFRRPGCRFVAEFLGGENIFEARIEKRDGKFCARLAWGKFLLAGDPGIETGWVQIRPESIAPANEQCPGHFKATVLSCSDRGVYRELQVETESGERLVWHAATAGGSAPAAGQSVLLRLAEPPHPIGADHA
jgi:molybdate transport system ATP-binding protein